MVKIGKILEKTDEWKFYYRFKKPSEIKECFDENDFKDFTKDKNIIALALDKYSFFE